MRARTTAHIRSRKDSRIVGTQSAKTDAPNMYRQCATNGLRGDVRKIQLKCKILKRGVP